MFTIYSIFIGALALYLVKQCSSHKINKIEMLPSLSWFLSITVPFALQWNDFLEPYRNVQLISITMVSIALVVGDSYRFPWQLISCDKDNENQQQIINHQFILLSRIIIYFLYRLINNPLSYFLIFCLFSVAHLFQMDQIPLLEQVTNRAVDEKELSLLRENSSKLLEVPLFLKYVFTWITEISAPIGISLLIQRRRFMLALSFLGIALVYSRITLSKSPSLILLISIALILYSNCDLILESVFLNISKNKEFSKEFRRYSKLFLNVVVVLFYSITLLFSFRCATFLINHQYSGFNYNPSPSDIDFPQFSKNDDRNIITTADRFRLVPPQKLTPEQRNYNYFFYRVVLVPSDVSSKWYQFYPDVKGKYLGWYGLTPTTRSRKNFLHPATEVGKWAYAEKFPDKYGNTVRAYASIDADVYARFGFEGVVIASLILLSLRLGLKFLVVKHIFLSRACYVIALLQISYILPSGSFQALFISHGFFILLLLLSLIKFFDVLNKVESLKYTSLF